MSQAESNTEGARQVASAADLLAGVSAGKTRAAKLSPGKDTSKENAARAVREGWKSTPGPAHVPTPRP